MVGAGRVAETGWEVTTAAEPSVLDWQGLVFAVAIAAGTVLLFGVAPSVHLSCSVLTLSSRTATSPRWHAQVSGALLLIQVVVTILLVTGSAALGSTFLRILAIDNGFALSSVGTLRVSFAGTQYVRQGFPAYYSEAARRLRAIPGITAIGATGSPLPLVTEMRGADRFTMDGAGDAKTAVISFISPDYFRAMGGLVIAGREFESADLSGGEPVVVISDELAHALGHPSDAVGRLLTGPRIEPRRIVGVARSLRTRGPLSPAATEAFFPMREAPAVTFVVRTDSPVAERLATIEAALASVDPRVPVFDVKSMESRLNETLTRPRLYATTVTFFGGLALLLAVVGISGIVSFACLRRLREMGIRIALGTTPTKLRRAFAGRIAGLVAVGIVAAGAIFEVCARQLATLIPGSEAAAASMFVAASVGTLLVAVAVAWLATARIARLDLTDVLRAEER